MFNGGEDFRELSLNNMYTAEGCSVGKGTTMSQLTFTFFFIYLNVSISFTLKPCRLTLKFWCTMFTGRKVQFTPQISRNMNYKLNLVKNLTVCIIRKLESSMLHCQIFPFVIIVFTAVELYNTTSSTYTTPYNHFLPLSKVVQTSFSPAKFTASPVGIQRHSQAR